MQFGEVAGVRPDLSTGRVLQAERHLVDALRLALRRAILRARFEAHGLDDGRRVEADLHLGGRTRQRDRPRRHNEFPDRRAIGQRLHGAAFEMIESGNHRGRRARIGQPGIDVERVDLQSARGERIFEIFDIARGGTVDGSPHNQPDLIAGAVRARNDGHGFDLAIAAQRMPVPALDAFLDVPGEADQFAIGPHAPDDRVRFQREVHVDQSALGNVVGQIGGVLGLVAVAGEVISQFAHLQSGAHQEQHGRAVGNRRHGPAAEA